MPDKYFPDAKEPHIHEHKGGVTYTGLKHEHKALQSGTTINKAICNAVIDDLKGGTPREVSIANWIKNLIRVASSKPAR